MRTLQIFLPIRFESETYRIFNDCMPWNRASGSSERPLDERSLRAKMLSLVIIKTEPQMHTHMSVSNVSWLKTSASNDSMLLEFRDLHRASWHQGLQAFSTLVLKLLTGGRVHGCC